MTETRTEDSLGARAEASDLPLVEADHLGLIRKVNRQFEEAWGWSEARLVGRPLATIVPESFRDAHQAGFSRFLVSGQGSLLDQPLVLPVLSGDGKEASAEVCLQAFQAGGQWRFAATARPLSEERPLSEDGPLSEDREDL